jgi:hypothetical protein
VGNADSLITSHHPKFNMVNTRSSHPLQPPPSASRASNNLELREFLKHIAESMEVLRKQNKDLNTRLTAAEAQSSQKERERTERREKEKRDRVRRGKQPVNPDQQDNETTVQRDCRTIHDEEHHDKSHSVESPNGGSHRERSQRERSNNEGSRHERREGEKSHRSRRHREKSHHDESLHNRHDAKMKDLEERGKICSDSPSNGWGRLENYGMRHVIR